MQSRETSLFFVDFAPSFEVKNVVMIVVLTMPAE